MQAIVIWFQDNTNKTHAITAAYIFMMWAAKYLFNADDSTLAMLVGVGAAFGISAASSDAKAHVTKVTNAQTEKLK